MFRQSLWNPRSGFFLTLFGVLLLSGCDGGTEPEPPVAIDKVSGNGQFGPAGQPLEESLVVRVVDRRGGGVEGVPLHWSVESGGGTVSPSTNVTGPGGQAEATWTLGPEEGPQQVAVSSEGLPTVHFEATAGDCPDERTFSLSVGESERLSGSAGSAFCLLAPPGGAEFVVVGFFTGPADDTLSLGFQASNVVPVEGSPLPASPQSVGGRSGSGTRHRHLELLEERVDHAFHLELHRRAERELAPLIRTPSGEGPAGAALTAPQPARVPSPGDVLTLNTQTESACNDPRLRGARVEALGQSVIVVADTLNPEPGFTREDYEEFARAFDEEIRPLTDELFGEPVDIDGTGRVTILFTQDVNRLTGPESDEVVLGFFFARDLFPREETDGLQACPASNERNMFYLRVPDEEGTVGSTQTRNQVLRFTLSTLTHEHQHLVNANRRIFVHGASGPHPFEELWLNEALSHLTEELFFYHRSGLSPRSNIDGPTLRGAGQAALDAFNNGQIINTVRLADYMDRPGLSSVYDVRDGTAMRGGAWHFLRYLVDRSGGGDEGRVDRLVNTTRRGFSNLDQELGTDTRDWLRDWSVALYADERVSNIPTRFTDPSWNHADLFGELGDAFPEYPLATHDLEDGTERILPVRGGGGAYLRVGVGAAEEALFRTRRPQGTLPENFSLTILRTH